MIIGIDGNEANVLNKVGVNTYAFNIIWGLYNLSIENKHKNKYYIFLKHKPHNDLPKENVNWKYIVLKSRSKWILTQLVPYLRSKKHNLDVFFTPSHYIPPFVSVPRVCSIMDLGYLEDMGQFRIYDYWQLKYWSAYSMRASKKTITISAQSERDIVRHYNNVSMNTYVTHLGYDKNRFNTHIDKNKIKVVKSKYAIVNDYILFMSTLKPSKNIDGLIKAWAKIESKHPETVLVIAGKKGWLYESIFKVLDDLNIQKRVIFTDFLPEEDKESLIKGAKAFVLPSFWEGFGLDVLSSMACGVPNLLSNVGSLPEVGGDAAIYFDPQSINEMAIKIGNILSLNEKDYNKLSEKCIKQANSFSWERCSELTLDIIESAKNV